MERIELFSGYRSARLARMAQSKVTSGLAAASMSEIGVTTAKRVSVFNTTSLATNTKACGV